MWTMSNEGSTYAFKKTGPDLKCTLHECVIINQLANSPNIINLMAIVINHDNTICGFVTPFMCSGDLESIFEKVCKNISLGDDHATTFKWPPKRAWACQITQAMAELHAILAYNGDLKPQNILIDPTG